MENVISKWHLSLPMSKKPFYPPMSFAALGVVVTVKNQSELHPDYFGRDCPYDAATIKQLKKLTEVREIEVPVEKVVEKIIEKRVEVIVEAAAGGGKRGPKAKNSGVQLDQVASEISELRQELKQLKIDGKALQTADKIQLIKLRASLVEKLINMDERVNNLKKLSLFQSTVLNILDDIMSEEQRQDFMKRIEPFAAAE